MASILARSLVSFSRSSVLPRVSTSVKHYSEKVSPYYEPTEGKLASKDASMPDEMGGTVGIERYELLEKARGNLDPFGTEGVFLAKRGTKEEPTLVPTVCEDRIVGCVCEEDSTTIRWTKMFLGETKRCQCGYFFKLVADS